MTTSRMTGTLHLARQIFKHDGEIHFRIHASVFPLPKRLDEYNAIYRLMLRPYADGSGQYKLYVNGWYLRRFGEWKWAYDYLIKVAYHKSKQFGFRMCLIPYDWGN